MLAWVCICEVIAGTGSYLFLHNILWYFIGYTHLSKSTEHPSHWLVVESFWAVDDDHIHAQSLAEIFDGLSLPSASRSLGTATSMEVEGSRQRHVTSGGERKRRFVQINPKNYYPLAFQQPNPALVVNNMECSSIQTTSLCHRNNYNWDSLS